MNGSELQRLAKDVYEGGAVAMMESEDGDYEYASLLLQKIAHHILKQLPCEAQEVGE